MVDLGETFGSITSGINVTGIIGTIVWGIIIVFVLSVIGIVSFIIVNKRKYKNKIVIFEKINGVPQDTGKDRACELKLNRGGDSVFFLQKRKLYLPTPRIQSGKRKYYFYIREDGEWINFSIKNIDETMRLADAHFLDKEVRYARTQLQKGLKERYETKNFLKEYAPVIISVMFIIIIGVFTFLLFDKWLGLAEVTNQGMKASGEVMAQAKQILASIDNIQAGGTGMIPATP